MHVSCDYHVISSSPLPQVRATLSLSCNNSLVGYSGSFSRLKLKVGEQRYNISWTNSMLASYQVLAVGSLLGVYSKLDIVNFVSPVAPTRLINPPRGTLELCT